MASSELALRQSDFDSLFTQWWQTLDSDDRFAFMHEDGGDERLARFVCALELQSLQGEKGVARAYVLATECTIESARKNAYGEHGLKHPAVVSLLVRLRHRTREAAWLRLEHLHVQLLENLAADALKPDADGETRRIAATALGRYAQLVRMDEAEERVTRSKRAAEAARGTLKGSFNEKDITPQSARYLLDVISRSLGTDGFRELVSSLSQTQGDRDPAV